MVTGRSHLSRGTIIFNRTTAAARRYVTTLFATPNGAKGTPALLIAGVLIVTAGLAITGSVAASAADKESRDRFQVDPNLRIVSSDEFNGLAGTLPSARLWNIRQGGGGWGNREKQVYTASPNNLSLDGSGNLRIVARRDGSQVTSARIDSNGKMGMSAGVLAVRAKLPEGQGIHPAIWMLGSSIDVVGYPESGEIDIFELANTWPNNSVGAIGPRTNLADKTPWKVQKAVPPSQLGDPDGYHVYWVDRTKGHIRIGIDGHEVFTVGLEDLPPQSVWVMDDPFFLVLNVAVGGDWPGAAGIGALPAEMSIDWVRLYG